MKMSKQIGNCLSCDAILWDDGVATGSNKSYGGNKEYCGDCLQDQALDDAREELKLWYKIASDLLAEREMRMFQKDAAEFLTPGDKLIYACEITTDPNEEVL